MLWLTKNTVRPCLRHLAHLAEALFLKRRVADGEHFVDDQNLRFEMRRDGERSRTYMPLEYRFTGVSMNFSDLGEGDDLVELRGRSPRASFRGSRHSGKCSRGR